MAQKNFAPAFFLIAGVIGVVMLAPKKKRGGTKTYNLDVTADMVIDACQAIGDNDPRVLSEYIAKVYFPEVPLRLAVESILPEMIRVGQEADSFGLPLCEYALGTA